MFTSKKGGGEGGGEIEESYSTVIIVKFRLVLCVKLLWEGNRFARRSRSIERQDSTADSLLDKINSWTSSHLGDGRHLFGAEHVFVNILPMISTDQ